MNLKFTTTVWAVVFRSLGSDDYIAVFDGSRIPKHLFATRAEARAFAKEKFGYIAKRPDLRRAPFHWNPPAVRKVKLTLQVVRDDYIAVFERRSDDPRAAR